MTTTLKDVMDSLSVTRRRKIAARAAELIAEEMSLRNLHRAARIRRAAIRKKKSPAKR